jgi:hypothetical protein
VLDHVVDGHAGIGRATRRVDVEGDVLFRVQRAANRRAEYATMPPREGRYFSAEEAVGYGLADEMATPDARMVRLPGRPIGFGPP